MILSKVPLEKPVYIPELLGERKTHDYRSAYVGLEAFELEEQTLLKCRIKHQFFHIQMQASDRGRDGDPAAKGGRIDKETATLYVPVSKQDHILREFERPMSVAEIQAAFRAICRDLSRSVKPFSRLQNRFAIDGAPGDGHCPKFVATFGSVAAIRHAPNSRLPTWLHCHEFPVEPKRPFKSQPLPEPERLL